MYEARQHWVEIGTGEKESRIIRDMEKRKVKWYKVDIFEMGRRKRRREMGEFEADFQS